jgi:hypothetical protein
MSRLGMTVVLGALAGALAFAQGAAASDTFTLDNSSKRVSLQGVSNWTGSEQFGPQSFDGCQTGPFPADDSTSYEFQPGDVGTLTMTRDPFSTCPSNIDTQTLNAVDPGLVGNVWWAPVDPPIGFASLTCAVVAQPNPAQLTATVDDQGSGLTCTVSDVAASPAASFISSAAPLRDGKAVTLVQHFPASGGTSGSAGGRHQITLRDQGGRFHGRKLVTLTSGRPKSVRVPISRKLRKRVAKRGFVEVKANLKRIDGRPGTGHRTKLIVMADGSSLPF